MPGYRKPRGKKTKRFRCTALALPPSLLLITWLFVLFDNTFVFKKIRINNRFMPLLSYCFFGWIRIDYLYGSAALLRIRNCLIFSPLNFLFFEMSTATKRRAWGGTAAARAQSRGFIKYAGANLDVYCSFLKYFCNWMQWVNRLAIWENLKLFGIWTRQYFVRRVKFISCRLSSRRS